MRIRRRSLFRNSRASIAVRSLGWTQPMSWKNRLLRPNTKAGITGAPVRRTMYPALGRHSGSVTLERRNWKCDTSPLGKIISAPPARTHSTASRRGWTFSRAARSPSKGFTAMMSSLSSRIRCR